MYTHPFFPPFFGPNFWLFSVIMIPCFFVQSVLGDLHLYLFVFILLGYDFLDVDAMGLHRVYIDVARYFFLFGKDIFIHLDSR